MKKKEKAQGDLSQTDHTATGGAEGVGSVISGFAFISTFPEKLTHSNQRRKLSDAQ